MRQDKQFQSESEQNQGQVGQDFSRQIPSEMRNRMKGEHSLQVDQSGESFRGAEEVLENNTVQSQRQQQQQQG